MGMGIVGFNVPLYTFSKSVTHACNIGSNFVMHCLWFVTVAFTLGNLMEIQVEL